MFCKVMSHICLTKSANFHDGANVHITAAVQTQRDCEWKGTNVKKFLDPTFLGAGNNSGL